MIPVTREAKPPGDRSEPFTRRWAERPWPASSHSAGAGRALASRSKRTRLPTVLPAVAMATIVQKLTNGSNSLVRKAKADGHSQAGEQDAARTPNSCRTGSAGTPFRVAPSACETGCGSGTCHQPITPRATLATGAVAMSSLIESHHQPRTRTTRSKVGMIASTASETLRKAVLSVGEVQAQTSRTCSTEWNHPLGRPGHQIREPCKMYNDGPNARASGLDLGLVKDPGLGRGRLLFEQPTRMRAFLISPVVFQKLPNNNTLGRSQANEIELACEECHLGLSESRAAIRAVGVKHRHQQRKPGRWI